MKLKDFSDLIVFDEFPNRYNPQQRIVLTHLLNLEKQILPERLCTIITTSHIAEQFKEYCKQKGAKCLSKANFIYVEPYNYIDIVTDVRRTLQMLFCESKEATRNLMVVIREDGKLKCIYTGNFLDIRTAVLNDTIASWIERDTVPHLYVNLKRCHENPQKQDVDLIFKVFDVVDKLLECHPNRVIHMYLPPYGYNNFISKLVCRFRKRVTLSSEFKAYLNLITENEVLELLCDNIEKSKIILFPGKATKRQVNVCTYTQCPKVTMCIQEEYKNIEDVEVSPSKTYYAIFYSPEPTPFQLQLLCLLLKPKRLVGIIDGFNINSKVPSYLIDLCGTTTPGDRNKGRSRFSESLRSLTEVKDTGKILTFGPRIINPTQRKEMYIDDSESD